MLENRLFYSIELVKIDNKQTEKLTGAPLEPAGPGAPAGPAGP